MLSELCAEGARVLNVLGIAENEVVDEPLPRVESVSDPEASELSSERLNSANEVRARAEGRMGAEDDGPAGADERLWLRSLATCDEKSSVCALQLEKEVRQYSKSWTVQAPLNLHDSERPRLVPSRLI